MGRSKGFVNTLEAVLASTIFLIFIINVLPAFTDTGSEQDNSVRKVGYVLESTDSNGVLREMVSDRDVEGIQSLVEGYVSEEVAVGMDFLERGKGNYSGEEKSIEFDVNDTSLRDAVLKLWISEDNGLTISVNGEEVPEISEGFNRVDIFENVSDGQNTLSFSGSGQLEFMVETYNFKISKSFPEEDVKGVGYPFAVYDGEVFVSEVSVYLW